MESADGFTWKQSLVRIFMDKSAGLGGDGFGDFITVGLVHIGKKVISIILRGLPRTMNKSIIIKNIIVIVSLMN